MDQNQELAEPPGYIGLHFVTMVMLGLVIFLIWALAMLLLHLGEKEEHDRANIERLLRLLQEQLQEGHDPGN